MKNKPTKIVRLELENFKRIRAVHIEPSGSVTKIGGLNAAGKSSILDGIDYLIRGRKAAPAKPVRNGENKATGTLELDNGLTIRRTITEAGNDTLVIETKDGARFPSPQAILDRLYGQFAFDPLEFMRASPKQRIEILKKIVGLDFSKLDAERAQIYAERTSVNRESDQALALARAAIKHDDAPREEVSVRALVEELNAAEQNNQARASLAILVQRSGESIELTNQTIDDLKRRLAEAESLRDATRKQQATASEKFAATVEIPTDPIKAKLSQAETLNAKLRANQKRHELEKLAAAFKEKSDAMTARIKEIDTEKSCMLASTAFPVDGLGFGECDVTLKQIPFDQGSKAEQLCVSAAIGVAVHPEFPVMLIRDGSLLDRDSLALLAEQAEKTGSQIFLEVVGDDKSIGIIIEDGQILNPNGDKLQAE